MSHPILSSFLDNKSLQTFIRDWPNQHISCHGPHPRLPDFFKQPLLSSISKLAQTFRGEIMECDSRTGSKMTAVGGESAETVMRRGATAYLKDIGHLLDGTVEFIAQLKTELGINAEAIRVGAFLSPTGNGASCHYDALDVISVQLIGNKRFHVSPVKEIRFPYGYQYNPDMPVFDQLYPQLQAGFPDPSQQKFETIEMCPGSVLCMPRGTWHHTVAQSNSLALSIVLSPPTELDRLLDQLSSTLLQSEVWRRPCYGSSSETKAHYRHLPAIISRLIERENNPTDATKCFAEKSRYICDPNINFEAHPKGDHFELTLNGNPGNTKSAIARMLVPKETVAVFDWLLEQSGPFSVRRAMRAFPALPLDYFRQIFQATSKAGLTRQLWFDPID